MKSEWIRVTVLLTLVVMMVSSGKGGVQDVAAEVDYKWLSETYPGQLIVPLLASECTNRIIVTEGYNSPEHNGQGDKYAFDMQCIGPPTNSSFTYGKTVVAAADGWAYVINGVVLVDHGSNYYTHYAHVDPDPSLPSYPLNFTTPDDQVNRVWINQGDSIATVGVWPAGNHLHFEVAKWLGTYRSIPDHHATSQHWGDVALGHMGSDYYPETDEQNAYDGIEIDGSSDNQPPNRPSLTSPSNGAWLNSRTAALSWRDGGDPDNQPQNYRDYYAEVWKSGWSKTYGWTTKTSWRVTVPSDGTYSWHVKANDGEASSAWSETRTFKVDTSPPSAPTISISGSGWYGHFTRDRTPSFTWSTSTDSLSGLEGYYAAIDDTTPDGRGTNDKWRGTSTSWTVPSKLGEGPHTLYVRAVDVAGNTATSSYRFNVDTSPPRPPSTINPGCDVSGGLLCAINNNNCWQNTCNDPAFTWSGATDNVKAGITGSGIQDYAYYWGTSEQGKPITRITETSFDPGPIAPTDGCAVYFLNMSLRDNLGNESKPGPAYVLKYDGAPPNITLQINGNDQSSNQVSVLLDVSAADGCSGVYQMRFSNNGLQWSDWQPYQSLAAWTVPALNQHWVTVYAQVRDTAGNTSPVVQDSIFLDLYPPRPSSASYRLCTDVLDTAGGSSTSASFGLVSAVGQPWAGDGVSSSGYSGTDGFLGAYAGCPITNTFTVSYAVTQQVVASGGNLRNSTSHRLSDTVGEPVVSAPSTRLLSSASFTLLSGFWANISGSVPLGVAAPTPAQATPTPTPTPGPTPTPQPGVFGVTAGELGTGFTNQTTTTLNLYAPNVSQVQISNEPTFISGTWQSYAVSAIWPYEPPGDVITGSRVYVRYRDDADTIYGDYSEVIFYDGVPPSGWAALVSITDTVATLELDAWDDNSGLHDMRLASAPTFSGATWLPYTTTVTTTLSGGQTIYVQFRDKAANVSEPVPVQFACGVYLPLVMRNP